FRTNFNIHYFNHCYMHTSSSIQTAETQDLVTTSIPHIQIKDLNVTIEGQRILKDINLSIPNNSVTSIIGPSGCGKTTLLKTLNRLVDDEQGVAVTRSMLANGDDIEAKEAEVTHIRKKTG